MYGMRFIRVLLADPTQLFEASPAALGYITPNIGTSDLYINNIFVNPEIHDIFIKRVGFQLIRVHLTERVIVNENREQVRLDQLKFPMEVMYVGARPRSNATSLENWYRFGTVTDVPISYPVSVPNATPPPLHQLAFNDAIWKVETPTLESIVLETKGVQLYRQNPVAFYNQYLPYVTSDTVTSPDSDTMYMLLFCMYPGAYQPSGHINLSRSRELFIDYVAPSITALAPCELVVIATCINFVIVGYGTLVLRYSL